MTAVPRSKRKPGEARTGPARTGSVRRELRGAIARPAVAVRREDVRDFIIAMSIELSDLAFKNGFDALAVVFDMAREVAESDRTTSDEHLRRP